MPDERPHVTYRYQADLPHPIEAAYAWLTDYRDDDADLTGEMVVERRVLRRSPEEVHMEGVIEPLGLRQRTTAVVKLDPKRHQWVATLGKGNMVFTYQLTPTPPGCRLDVEYRVYSRRWTRLLVLRLARRRAERQIAEMWEGFFTAMRKDLVASSEVAAATS